jgi:hypothetical protein
LLSGSDVTASSTASVATGVKPAFAFQSLFGQLP